MTVQIYADGDESMTSPNSGTLTTLPPGVYVLDFYSLNFLTGDDLSFTIINPDGPSVRDGILVLDDTSPFPVVVKSDPIVVDVSASIGWDATTVGGTLDFHWRVIKLSDVS